MKAINNRKLRAYWETEFRTNNALSNKNESMRKFNKQTKKKWNESKRNEKPLKSVAHKSKTPKSSDFICSNEKQMRQTIVSKSFRYWNVSNCATTTTTIKHEANKVP